MTVATITRDGDIAVVTVDNPPVNALGQALRQALWDAVETLDADPAVRAVVLICAGRTFIAGADVTEFGKPPVPPHLPDLVDRLEQATKPWIAAALAAVGAEQYADMPVGLLSGGEQQRLRMAQALVADPALLLCDEPLLSLDPASQRAITALVDRRRREHSTAVVFVTHEINPVLPFVDRVLYLANGTFRIGTVDDVLTSATLSELYGSRVEVVRAGGQIFVAGLPETPRSHLSEAGAA